MHHLCLHACMQMSLGGMMRQNRIHRMARNILQYLLDHQRAGQPQTRELVIRSRRSPPLRHVS